MARILLVEDELLVRELAYEDLCDAGFDVTVAGDGDKALAMLQDGRHFDLLLTDIKMPGSIDGWQLAREARRALPEVKIVYASGMGENAGEVDSEDRMLTKPYRKSDLLGVIEELGVSA